MKIKSSFLIAGLASFSLFGGAAQAAVITGLTNTGVDLGLNNVDLAWEIVGGANSPQLSYPSAVYADSSNGTFPVGPWVYNTATSAWDTPSTPLNQNLDLNVNGYYAYQTTFNVSGPVLRTAGYLAGQFAADNEVASITFNGVTIYTGPTDGSSQYSSFTAFSDFGNFVTGVNTLVFNVVNYPGSGNPSGLDVQFTASAVPEASSWVMMLLGFAGLGFVGYRKTKSVRTGFAA
ncbi:PEP-CTERM sorting domain-containing protein [Rhodoblastus sp.]|uniref:PEP-CTERM sorting domain-containing protein n=1 Tax=Rhodoblastus sp. TaxID=1962975 RepID=UPI003F95C339